MKKTQKRVFTDEEFSSKNGFLTKVWGSSVWHGLHVMSFNYPTNPTHKNKQDYKNYVLSLFNVLPCKYCRINIKKTLLKFPLTHHALRNRDTFSRYIYELHEKVNAMLNKKSGLSYEEIRERYEHFRSRCTKIKKTLKVRHKTESGCIDAMYGKKIKCVMKFVPETDKCELNG